MEVRKLEVHKLKPKDVLNPFYLKKPILQGEFDTFNKALSAYKQGLIINAGQNEKSLVPNVLAPFFQSLGFNAKSADKQEGNSEIDLSLNKEQREVLIEAKRWNSNEFITPDRANAKALQEAILYFLRERARGNNALKFIIITDFYQFYIFKAKTFEQFFHKNRVITSLYATFCDKNSLLSRTNEFYAELEKILDSEKFHANIFRDRLFNADGSSTSTLPALYIDLKPELNAENDFPKLKELFKIFHKDFLFKEFNPNDANTLNEAFYNELLYILGLMEKKVKSTFLIIKSEESDTQGTLYKGINDKLRDKLQNPEFEDILSLIILWLNRILFLKLIEARLISFNAKDKEQDLKFLSYEKIPNFKTLSHLFFEVLAKPYKERKGDEKFKTLPYLNSSLFAKKEIENTLDISALDDDLELTYFKFTQIKDNYCNKKQGKTKLLKYLFEFLDSFDFGSYEQENTLIKQKELINSSVLGAVFEKLNGYKEGSFYTPSFITSYMCKESLQKVVLEKFNTAFDCKALDLESLKDQLRNKRGLNKQEQDAFRSKCETLLRSIKICDPSVGSGHFLVSALVAMIKIYDELSLFRQDFYTKTNQDELQILSFNGEFIEYKKPSTLENNRAQLIQQELFNLKKSIIENNLFGVDINPNSCEIAKLRLWIELLKHSFYLSVDAEFENLETLPNIDINIKCGNSLISHFPTFEYDKNQKPERYTFAWLKQGESGATFTKNFKQKLLRYNDLVQTYKEKLGDKKQIENEIKELKQFFKNTLLNNSFTMKSLEDNLKKFVQTYGDDYFDIETPFGMEMLKIIRKKAAYKFQPALGEQLEPKRMDKEGQDLLDKIYREFEYLESLRQSDTFEWRFEFPEVLDLETFEEKQARIQANNLTQTKNKQDIKDTFGDFLGFDLIIGNPPYIKEADNKRLFEGTKHLRTYQGKMDIWYHFVGKGFDFVKNQGFVSFIATNNWVTNSGAKNLRNVILKEAKILNLVDFGSYMCFDSASIQTMVMEFQKLDSVPKNYTFKYARIDSKKPKKEHREAILERQIFEDNIYLAPTITPLKLLDKPLTFSNSNQEQILEKILKNGKVFLREDEAQIGIGLTDKVKARMGLKGYKIGTGIFQLSQKELENLKLNKKEFQLIKPLYTSNELFRFYGNPKNNEWIIYTDSSFKNPNSMDSYPNLKKHLDKFKKVITSDNKPYGLHRAKQEYFFNKTPSIVSLRKCPDKPSFTYVDFDCYVTSTFFVIQTHRINLKFLTGLFNSKLIAFWLRHKGKMQGNHYQIDKEPLLHIPIPKITKQNQNIGDSIIALVDEILEQKAKDSTFDTSELESQIDSLVYRLYNLTSKEIGIIENKQN